MSPSRYLKLVGHGVAVPEAHNRMSTTTCDGSDGLQVGKPSQSISKSRPADQLASERRRNGRPTKRSDRAISAMTITPTRLYAHTAPASNHLIDPDKQVA